MANALVYLIFTAATAVLAAAPGGKIDELYRRRDDDAVVSEIGRLVDQGLAASANDYELLWRAARLRFWQSDRPDLDKPTRSRLGKEGWDLAERAVAANPNRVEGHFWAVLNMGNYVAGVGIMRALTSGIEGKFKGRLQRATALDPGYEHGAIDMAWGRYFAELPWPKRDRNKAEQHYRRALALNPHALRCRVFWAGLMLDDGRAVEAKKLLDEVAAATPGAYDAPEERRAQKRGAKLMPKVLAALK